MNRSPEITEIATALSKAQSQIENAAKEGMNPHFGKSYATLKSVVDVCKIPLSENGLSYTQAPETDTEKHTVTIITTLLHSSGQWIESSITMPITDRQWNCQGIGSAITYGRRYALSAMVGIAPDDDDDGNAATPPPQQQQRQQQKQPPSQQTSQQQQPPPQKDERTDLEKVCAFLTKAGCANPEDANLLIDYVAPSQTLETIKTPEIATFVLGEIMSKIKAGEIDPATVLNLAQDVTASVAAFPAGTNNDEN